MSCHRGGNFSCRHTCDGSSQQDYLKKHFSRKTRQFLEESTYSDPSTVAARSNIGQGLSCFCPTNLITGDEHALLQLICLLLDGSLETGWIRGSKVEACKAEYQSLAQEQRELERSSTKSRSDVGIVLSFCSSQAGLGARFYLYKMCIVSSHVQCIVVVHLECSLFS